MSIRLLDRYVWRQLGEVVTFGVGIFTLLLLVNRLFLVARLVLQQGAAFSVALQLLIYKLPYLLAYSFPMAMLLAALLAIGRLSDGQEITAMRTSGISLGRIALSVTTAGILVSAMTLALNEGVVPYAENRYQQVLIAGLRERFASEQQDVLFRDVQEDVESVYFVRRFHRDQQRMEGVVVNQFERGVLNRVVEAEVAQYTDGAWVFRDGTMYVVTGETTVVTQFARLRVGLQRTPEQIAVPQRDPSEMSIRELRQYITVLRRSGTSAARYIVQVHFKLAVPMSAALFALLAVPVGLRPHRSGTSIGLGLAFLVIIGYYIISSVTITLGDNGRLHPVPAAWLPDVVLAVVGLALVRRADR